MAVRGGGVQSPPRGFGELAAPGPSKEQPLKTPSRGSTAARVC